MKNLLAFATALFLTSCAYYQEGSANNSVNITPQYNYGGYGYGNPYYYSYGYYPYVCYSYYGGYGQPWGWRYW